MPRIISNKDRRLRSINAVVKYEAKKIVDLTIAVQLCRYTRFPDAAQLVRALQCELANTKRDHSRHAARRSRLHG